ncbi:unnamed protein product [Ectocarpus sp. CCAP 1310/34]|nr:unnamed protein product [Ectocarpus sp. CCAP 1310/34]
MNIFRLAGDMSHTASILMLLLKLRASKSAAGISLKTQELFLVVFLTRYVDLFFRFISCIMKVLYITLTSLIIYMIREHVPTKATYDKSQDSFLHWQFAVAPCAVLALLIHSWSWWTESKPSFSFINYFWTFSEVLEPFAIVPQLMVLQRYREVENLTGHYVFLLGAYRSLYLVNWVYRAHYEDGYQHNVLVYIAGLVQSLLYADFFYYYAISKYYGGRMSLPA